MALPQARAAHPVKLRNEHLQYAITWFGLAAVVVVMFAFWLRSRRRDGTGPSGIGYARRQAHDAFDRIERKHRMSYQTIELRKSTPQGRCRDFWCRPVQPLGNQQFQEVHDALMDCLVIFFRDQKLSVEQHMDFGRRFGKLHMHPASPDVLQDYPGVLVIKADDKAKYIAGEDWHSDVSCDPEPPMGSILYLTEVPPDGGGDTMFANMYLAYQTLSKPIRRLIDGLSRDP